MMELLMAFNESAVLAAVSTDRAELEMSTIVRGILTILFLVAIVPVALSKSPIAIITTTIIYGVLMALAGRLDLVESIGLWFLGLFVR